MTLPAAVANVTPSGTLMAGKRSKVDRQWVRSISGDAPGGGRLVLFVATDKQSLPVEAVESSGSGKTARGELVRFDHWGEKVQWRRQRGRFRSPRSKPRRRVRGKGGSSGPCLLHRSDAGREATAAAPHARERRVRRRMRVLGRWGSGEPSGAPTCGRAPSRRRHVLLLQRASRPAWWRSASQDIPPPARRSPPPGPVGPVSWRHPAPSFRSVTRVGLPFAGNRLLVSASSAGTGGGGPGQVSIDTLTPSSGTAGGGSTIEISGSGFTGATAVDFGRNASSDFTVTSDTTIAAVAPVGAGVVTVQVVTPSGTSSSSSEDRFTYVPPGQLPITAQGQSLEIGGAATQFTGFNAYQLATQVGTNAGCGSMATTAQIDSFFGSLRPNSVVRFWAFQGALATNVNTGQTGLGAARQRLLPGRQAFTCT